VPPSDVVALPVFAVPGGDGDEGHMVRLARLARHLNLNCPFYGLLAADANGATEQPPVEAVAAEYVRYVQERQPEGPYLLLGACIGGLVAFEMAQQLVAQGEKVAGLILVDTRRPQMQRYDRARPRRRKDREFHPRVETLLHYRPSRYPGRVTLFLNERWHAQNPTLGWWSLAGGGIDTHVLPGDHRLFQLDRILVLADRLRPCLDAMLRSAAPRET
jgi:thioesterase domain-containing protein